ncbi:MAG: sulfurtransferase TusA family protein, partial [Deltaproteobacteria bacterium]|nr:sulfurtransferase TusA family protein [Deltaproteobacteria bacterium]
MNAHTHTLDLSGLACPQPVLKCRAFLEQAGIHAFTAYVDNEAASLNVRNFLEQRGFVASVEKEGSL